MNGNTSRDFASLLFSDRNRNACYTLERNNDRSEVGLVTLKKEALFLSVFVCVVDSDEM